MWELAGQFGCEGSRHGSWQWGLRSEAGGPALRHPPGLGGRGGEAVALVFQGGPETWASPPAAQHHPGPGSPAPALSATQAAATQTHTHTPFLCHSLLKEVAWAAYNKNTHVKQN